MNKKVLYGVPTATVLILTAYNLGGKAWWDGIKADMPSSQAMANGSFQSTYNVPASEAIERLRDSEEIWRAFANQYVSQSYLNMEIAELSDTETGILLSLGGNPLVEITSKVEAKGAAQSSLNYSIILTPSSFPAAKPLNEAEVKLIEKVSAKYIHIGMKRLMDQTDNDLNSALNDLNLSEKKILSNLSGSISSNEIEENDEDFNTDSFVRPEIDISPSYGQDDESYKAEIEAQAAQELEEASQDTSQEMPQDALNTNARNGDVTEQ